MPCASVDAVTTGPAGSLVVVAATVAPGITPVLSRTVTVMRPRPSCSVVVRVQHRRRGSSAMTIATIAARAHDGSLVEMHFEVIMVLPWCSSYRFLRAVGFKAVVLRVAGLRRGNESARSHAVTMALHAAAGFAPARRTIVEP